MTKKRTCPFQCTHTCRFTRDHYDRQYAEHGSVNYFWGKPSVPYIPSVDEEFDEELDEELDQDEYDIENIIGHRPSLIIDNVVFKYEFCVMWKGYSINDATWEPTEHFTSEYAMNLLLFYKNSIISIDIYFFIKN